jgi:hypothetical protein
MTRSKAPSSRRPGVRSGHGRSTEEEVREILRNAVWSNTQRTEPIGLARLACCWSLETKLANPMLSGVTGGAYGNRVAITRLDPYSTIGSRMNMRGFRWCCFAAGYAGS